MGSKINNETVIRLFRERQGFLSGEEVARELGVTRAAVWKKITALKRNGYVFETSAARGYRLVRSPDLSVEDLRNALSGRERVIGREVLFYSAADSTNTLAAELAGAGAAEGTVVIADSQTGGRGRRGRTWLSPPGKNLYMSVIVRPALSPRDATLLTLMTAVAATAAMRTRTHLPVSIKWPNDLMVRGKKLGGILTEIKADMDRIFHAVIGIGININLEHDDMPDDIKDTATSVSIEAGAPRMRTPFAVELLEELDRWYGLLVREGRGPITAAWRRMSSTIGRAVRVVLNDEVLTGIAEDIDEEGMLLVREDTGGEAPPALRKISAGDITILR